MEIDRRSYQGLRGLLPHRLQAIDQRTARGRDLLSEPSQLGIPGVGLRRFVFECGVALLQRSGVATPGVRECRFHVEHRPVQPAAAAMATLLNQLMDTRVDHLHRKALGELRQRSCGGPVDSGQGATCRNLKTERPSWRVVGPPKDNELLLSVSDQSLGIARSKRTATAQEKQGLKY